MSVIARVKLRWSGFIGGPGYTILHFRDFGWDTAADVDTTAAQGAVDRVDTFAEGVKTYLPYAVQLAVEPEVEVLEDTTGELLEVRGTTPDAAHVSPASSSAVFAGPVGLVISWKTGLVRNGRRVHGRTFLVPLNGNVFASDGTLTSGVRTDFLTAAAALANPAGTPDLGVWARPSAPAATDGEWGVVTSWNVPDMAAVLRSRRD
jgi:hypothetical protein